MTCNEKTLPRAVATGMLFGRIECCVLSDGRRVITSLGIEQARQDLHAARTLVPLLRRLAEVNDADVEFQRGDTVVLGYDSDTFVGLCDDYADRFVTGELAPHEEHLGLAAFRTMFMFATAGADALIDEAADADA